MPLTEDQQMRMEGNKREALARRQRVEGGGAAQAVLADLMSSAPSSAAGLAALAQAAERPQPALQLARWVGCCIALP